MIVGNQLSKIEAKKGELSGQIKIKSNVELTDVSKKAVNVGEEKKNLLNINFRFNVEYSENTAINIEGVVYYADTEDKLDELVARWKKDKKLGAELSVPILNHAMEVGYIQAIGIAEKLKLPAPMNMPKFIPKEKK